MLRFSTTHTCSHLEHNHAPPFLLPRGICETSARELKPLDHGLNLRRRRFALSRQAGGGSVLLLGKVWNLDLNHRSPILRKFCLLKSLSPCLQKNVHLSKTGLCLPNTKIRSTFVNQKEFRRILFTQRALPICSRLSQPSLFSLRIILQSECEMNRTKDLSSYKG